MSDISYRAFRIALLSFMKLVILGRDGVINVAPATYVDAPENWEPLPGSLEALARLHRDGYRVVIVTHQPAVAHGALHMETLNRIHARMLDLIRHKGGEVEAIFVCPHGPESRCRCRPPLPGLFEELAERLKINLSGVMMVATSDEEITAAREAGAQPVRIEPNGKAVNGLPTFENLQQFSDALVSGRLVLR
jgi:D-glycero-D-manno-heptose 1,7-bisphosphate phosphatase